MEEWKNAPPTIGVNGGIYPNYMFSIDELRRLHERIFQAKQYYERKHIAPRYLGSKTLSVGYYPEPDDPAHVNYCGPAATLIALSVRQSTPADLLETVATEELIHQPNPPNGCAPGVCISKVVDVLNDQLNTSYYSVGVAQNSDQFYTWVLWDIDNNFALVTGTMTTHMPGWSVDAKHIVAVHGYWEPSGSRQVVKYIETASPTAGYNGPYYQSENLDGFWGFVRDNNAQAW